MDNHIQEYFNQKEIGQGNELFRVDENNVDIKTEVNEKELRQVNVLMANDDFLMRKGIAPIYTNYYSRFLRLKISLDRKGRGEYVQVNRRDNTDETLSKLGDMSNILGAKK